MTAYLLTLHLINFLAPAALMALLVVLFARFFGGFFAPKGLLTAPGLAVQMAVNFAVGVGVLAAGLVVLGRDAKMMTYLALILATATSQWWQLGGGRNSWQALKNSYSRKR